MVHVGPFSSPVSGITDSHVVDVQAEHVVAVEVTNSDVSSLALILREVEGVLSACTGSFDYVGERYIAAQVIGIANGNISSKVLFSIAGILTTSPERKLSIENYLRRYQPVVGAESFAKLACRGQVTSATVAIISA